MESSRARQGELLTCTFRRIVVYPGCEASRCDCVVLTVPVSNALLCQRPEHGISSSRMNTLIPPPPDVRTSRCNSRLFSRVERMENVRVKSMWPVSEQVFGIVVK